MGLSPSDLPSNVEDSEVLTGHDLNLLLKAKSLPNQRQIEKFAEEPEISAILQVFADNPDEQLTELHKLAKEFILAGDVEKAWLTILQC